MKKNYEKDQLIISIIFIFIIIEIIVVMTFIKKDFRCYKVLPAVVISDKYLKIYVDNKTIKQLKGSKYLYIDNKKQRYKVINVERKVLRKNKLWYHEILLRILYPKKYRENDTIYLTIYQRKRKIYEIFKSCWKE